MTHPDIWGRCGPCDRWFYCEGYLNRRLPAPVCPVCSSEPAAIENRAVEVQITLPDVAMDQVGSA